MPYGLPWVGVLCNREAGGEGPPTPLVEICVVVGCEFVCPLLGACSVVLRAHDIYVNKTKMKHAAPKRRT